MSRCVDTVGDQSGVGCEDTPLSVQHCISAGAQAILRALQRPRQAVWHEGLRGLYRGFIPGLWGMSHGAIQWVYPFTGTGLAGNTGLDYWTDL